MALRSLSQSLAQRQAPAPAPSVAGAYNLPGQSAAPAAQSGPRANPLQIIQQFQATHPATADAPAQIIAALNAQGINATPYMYGNVPSGNEINLGGTKFKVIGGENSGNPSWYTPGTVDSGGGGGGAAMGALTPAMMIAQQALSGGNNDPNLNANPLAAFLNSPLLRPQGQPPPQGQQQQQAQPRTAFPGQKNPFSNGY